MDESWSKIEILSDMEGIVNVLDEIEEDTVRMIDRLVNKNIGMESDHKTTKSQRRPNDKQSISVESKESLKTNLEWYYIRRDWGRCNKQLTR